MFFNWLKKRRRRKLRAASPSPEACNVVEKHLWQYQYLSDAEQAKLHGDAAVLIAEKQWEGCNGLAITESMTTTIAAQIALMTLGFPEQTFDRVQSVLLYPGAYNAVAQRPAAGFVVEHDSPRLGEAWYRGPVILSWPDVQSAGAGPNQGNHLVIHEFAHQLDTLNGRHADGNPVIESNDEAEHWLNATTAAFDRLREACQMGKRPLLDCYGATDRAEFFAVASEAFFQTPARLAEGDRPLFDVLRNFYGQDPLRWDR